MAGLRINPNLEIDDAELEFEFSRSGGPGGQHVNKTSTKVALLFHVDRSASLSDFQKQLVRTRLANRITEAGVLRLECSTTRSQQQNREEAIARFVALIASALIRPKTRRATKPTRGSVRRRIDDKRARGETKRLRGDGSE